MPIFILEMYNFIENENQEETLTIGGVKSVGAGGGIIGVVC